MFIKIVLAGGGPSGGHITPNVAVAEELKKLAEVSLLWIGGGGTLSAETAHHFGIRFEMIPAGKWHRYWAIGNLFAPFLVIAGIFQSMRILRRFRPNAVFVKGGFVSLPVAIAAYLMKIPIVVHESDVYMGWSNQIAARLAERVCVSAAVDYFGWLPHDKIVETGVPIRTDFFTRRPIRLVKNGPRRKRRILIMGGGQGSHQLNLLVRETLSQLVKRYEVIHLTGAHEFEAVGQRSREGYATYSFVDLHKMAKLLRSADLVISRSGATTLAEISAAGKPAILIPLANSANHHQRANALRYSQAGAAETIDPHRASAHHLVATTEAILETKGRVRHMKEQTLRLARPDAARDVAQILLDAATQR